MIFRLFCLVASFLASYAVLADASTGEFLGYEIGSSFVFEGDEKPDLSGADAYVVESINRDFDDVVLKLIPDSYIVTEITGRKRVKTFEVTVRVFHRYKTVLSQKYPDWELACTSEIVRSSHYYWPSDLTADTCVFSGGHPGYLLTLKISYLINPDDPRRPRRSDQFLLLVSLSPRNEVFDD